MSPKKDSAKTMTLSWTLMRLSSETKCVEGEEAQLRISNIRFLTYYVAFLSDGFPRLTGILNQSLRSSKLESLRSMREVSHPKLGGDGDGDLIRGLRGT